MASQEDARAQLRTLIDDLNDPPSKIVRQEDLRRSVLGDQVNGTNKFFQLNNRRIVEPTALTTSLIVISDGVTLAPVTGYTDDPVRGTFTVVGAAPATSLLARYDFLYFLDDEIDGHLQNGLRFVGYSDVTGVPDLLLNAALLSGAGYAFQALAARTAPLYDASAGGKTLNKASIKKHWLDLAAMKFKEAKEALDNYYTRQGQRNAPAYGQFNTGQVPYTPKR